MVEPSLPVRNISSPHWFCLIGHGFMQFLAQGGSFPPSARFLSDLLQPTFNSGPEANPQNYLHNCSFWPQECHPVFSEGLSQGFVVLGSGTPVGWVIANHIFLTHPSPGYCWGTLSSHSPISRQWGSGMSLDKVTGHNYGVLKLLSYKDTGQAELENKK